MNCVTRFFAVALVSIPCVSTHAQTCTLQTPIQPITHQFVDCDVVIATASLPSGTVRVVVFNGSITITGDLSGAGLAGSDGANATDSSNATAGNGGQQGTTLLLETYPSASPTPPLFRGSGAITINGNIDLRGGQGGAGGNGYNEDPCGAFPSRAGQMGGSGGRGGNFGITSSGPIAINAAIVTMGGNGGRGGNGGNGAIGAAAQAGVAGAGGNGGTITITHSNQAKNATLAVSGGSFGGGLFTNGGAGGDGGNGSNGANSAFPGLPGGRGGFGGAISMPAKGITIGNVTVSTAGGTGGLGGAGKTASASGYSDCPSGCVSGALKPSSSGGLGGAGGGGGLLRVQGAASSVITVNGTQFNSSGGHGSSAGLSGCGSFDTIVNCTFPYGSGCNTISPSQALDSGSGGAAGAMTIGNTQLAQLTVSVNSSFDAVGGNGSAGVPGPLASAFDCPQADAGAQGGRGGSGGAGGAISLNYVVLNGVTPVQLLTRVNPCGGNGANGGDGGQGNPGGLGGLGGGAGTAGIVRFNAVQQTLVCTSQGGQPGQNYPMGGSGSCP